MVESQQCVSILFQESKCTAHVISVKGGLCKDSAHHIFLSVFADIGVSLRKAHRELLKVLAKVMAFGCFPLR